MNSEAINGYVRPIVMLMFAGAFIVGFFMKLLGAEAFIGAFGTVLAWFFKTRDEQKQGEQLIEQIKEAKKR